MRDDIAKKLCERPRYGGAGKHQFRSERRRSKDPREMDSLPKKESMRRHHIKGYGGKYLNEYFPPLIGFLKKNVGRPWDKVFSEICQNLNPSSTVHKHVFDHLLRDFVETKPIFVEGSKIPYSAEFSYDGKLSEVRMFYVDSHGLLKDNTVKRRQRSKRRRKQEESNCKPINDREDYRKINGVWFHVWYDHLREGETGYDVIQRQEFTVARYGCFALVKANGKALKDGEPIQKSYKDPNVVRVATEKKQVSKKEIKKEGLNSL